MKQLRRIIVGHDLAGGGETALKSALALAKRCGAALRVVHVVEPLHAYQRISHPLTSPYTLEEITEKTGARLRELTASPELSRVQVEYEVRKGKPFIELIIAARAWLADLIAVGDTSQVEEPFLGGTSERILRKAFVPVMVAKKPLSFEAKTFLVPTDFSSCARKAAEEALMLAKSFSGRVIFFHVLDLYSSYTVAYAQELGVSVPTPPPSPEELEPEWESFLAGLDLEKVGWEKCAEDGQAAAAIVRKAKEMQADMIVIGTHGRSGLPHMLLGSVAEKVVRTASCPILTIRPEAFQFEIP
ncbi:MAG TPA: universal stress protein [Candidatus Binatia bacterium]|nr:universal stress protein [Candidatus Binatia bacterium]